MLKLIFYCFLALSPLFGFSLFGLLISVDLFLYLIIFVCSLVLSLLIHEFGHFLVLRLLEVKDYQLSWSFGGVDMEYTALPKQVILISIMGPVFSFLTCIVAIIINISLDNFHLGIFALFNFLGFVVNILPFGNDYRAISSAIKTNVKN
jgi:hypothetical protein